MLEFEILLIFPLFTSFFFSLSLNLLALIIMVSVVVVAYLLNLFDAGSAIVIRSVSLVVHVNCFFTPGGVLC